MSDITVASVADQNTSATLPIKYEQVTFAVVYTPNPAEGDQHGKPTKVRHTSSVKDINTLKGLSEDGSKQVPYVGAEVIAFEQTVKKPLVGTLEGFQQLITDGDEQINIINKGINSKFNQKIRTTLIEQEADGSFSFAPVEGAYDATPLVQEEAKRTTLNPTERALKMLGNLPQDQLQAILAAMQANLAAGNAGE
jgi:hypothetical protein